MEIEEETATFRKLVGTALRPAFRCTGESTLLKYDESAQTYQPIVDFHCNVWTYSPLARR